MCLLYLWRKQKLLLTTWKEVELSDNKIYVCMWWELLRSTLLANFQYTVSIKMTSCVNINLSTGLRHFHTCPSFSLLVEQSRMTLNVIGSAKYMSESHNIHYFQNIKMYINKQRQWLTDVNMPLSHRQTKGRPPW